MSRGGSITSAIGSTAFVRLSTSSTPSMAANRSVSRAIVRNTCGVYTSSASTPTTPTSSLPNTRRASRE